MMGYDPEEMPPARATLHFSVSSSERVHQLICFWQIGVASGVARARRF